MRTSPQRGRFHTPKVRRGFTFHFQNVHRATVRVIRPTQIKCAEDSRSFSKRAPRHSESDSTHLKTETAQRVHFAFTSHFQNVHRATARAIRPTRSAQRAHFAFQNTHRATARAIRPTQSAQGFSLHSLCICNMCTAPQRERFDPIPAPQREQLDPPKALRLPRHRRARSKVLRLPRILRDEFCTTSSKVLRLSRKVTLQRHARSSKCRACHDFRI